MHSQKITVFNSFLFLELIICLVLVSFFPPTASAAPQSGDEKYFAGLEQYINKEMKKIKVPGLSISIFNADKIIYSKGFGVKNIKTGAFVDKDTVFEAASFSKTLTAYAAMKLVEKGTLSLDTPLDKYLDQPYLPNPKYENKITLRMALTHTSGLSNDSDGYDRKVYFNPGDHFSYSGAAFRYLQEVIEAVTAKPFAEFMNEAIIHPLAMESSSFVLKDGLLPLMSNGHIIGKEIKVSPISTMEVNAAYSLLTTADDMAKFNMEICHPTLLEPETVADMLKPAVKWTNNFYWGLGIGILKSETGDFFWHWGNNYDYRNIMVTSKDSKTGVVIMTNSTTGMRLARRLAAKIINEYCGGNIDIGTFDLIQ